MTAAERARALRAEAVLNRWRAGGWLHDGVWYRPDGTVTEVQA